MIALHPCGNVMSCTLYSVGKARQVLGVLPASLWCAAVMHSYKCRLPLVKGEYTGMPYTTALPLSFHIVLASCTCRPQMSALVGGP